MKEAVSLGLKVEGTMMYSPGVSLKNSMISREFIKVSVEATVFLMKNWAGNFPSLPLYCNKMAIQNNIIPSTQS